ncbi:MAG TPA: hypothetical protein DEQ74_01715 [Wolbachia sp.]|jgi:hypothetical protein|uniref:hypothetical protein n=1 Tax=Wolbachia endosymbiont of Pentalonia nigronervosa TaxID=1301914 RepID=UPI000EE48362|nr:hypothetical protein [Wolbachia endosymbiont of Pentalonia nigronervosa]MBD0391240.1 hypothetical protein [Wolbachia endosymbiont of Pentalonia nigronervosa]HCE59533.1 hypothetical protein [Wolbachia sp.]
MSFFDDVNKRITSNAVRKGGVITPLAIVEGSSKKKSLMIRIAVPMVRLWNWINSKNNKKENAIQPAQVRGVSVFYTNLVGQQPKSTNGTDVSPSANKKVSFNPTLFTLLEEDEDNLSISTDDGISLGSSKDFDDEEWAAMGLPVSPIKKVGLVQKTKNILGSVVDFFMSPFKSKQTSTTTNAHLGFVVLDDSTTPSYVGFDHWNTTKQATTSDISTCVEKIDTEPQQHTATIESVAAIVPTLV